MAEQNAQSPPQSLDITSTEGIVEFVDPITDTCNLCTEKLLDPYQTKCGHRLCKSCLLKHFENNGDPSMCPFDDEDCEIISLKKNDGSVYPDFYLLKQLKKKRVYCKFKVYGCPEIVQLGKFTQHAQQCKYGKVECIYADLGCPEMVPRQSENDHAESCPYTPVTCKHCNSTRIAKCKMSDHLDECGSVRIACPHHCGVQNILRSELPSHEMDCPLKPMECSFKPRGCTFKGREDEVNEHERTESAFHLKLFQDYVKYLEREMHNMEKQLEDVSTGSKFADEKFQEQLKVHEQRILRQENRIKDTQKVVAKHDQALQEVKTENGNSPKPPVTEGIVTTETIGRLASLESMHSRTLSTMQRLEDQARNQGTKLAEFDLRFQVLETASYNGVLIWKIKDYKRRKEDAKNGGILSLYSQAFYTSRHSYRMCARVYLNGDGMGAGTHLSLFFVVMRGEYDALIKWPFRQKVSLMLLDQVGHTRHISDTFRPDPSSSSFQRPRSEMNIASGCPLFVSHAVLEAKDSLYLRDDTIFIKIVVDTDGIPSD